MCVIEEMMRDQKLELETEDELVEAVNKLYKSDVKYSILYEYVEFINVGALCMKEFAEKFDFNDLSNMTRSLIVARLVQDIQKDESVKGRHEYISPKYLIEIQPKKDQFDGIFNYHQTHGNIKDEIDITYNLLQYEDKDNYFETDSLTNSWICFEFKNHQKMDFFMIFLLNGQLTMPINSTASKKNT